MHSKSKLILLLGAVFIFCGLGLLVFSINATKNTQKKAADMMERLEEILPPRSMGIKDDYSSMQMPVLELDGIEVIGIVEIPEWNVALPFISTWNTKTFHSLPQRFSGTIYDDSLIVGGMDQAGQFDCLKKLDIGNEIIVTDMTGAQFSYVVERIERRKSAEAEVLEDEQSKLTLFVRDASSMEYIMVRCK